MYDLHLMDKSSFLLVISSRDFFTCSSRTIISASDLLARLLPFY